MKQQFRIDTAGTFKTYIYKDNRKAVPTSATLTVYKPGSTTDKVVDAQAMTVASDGLLSYSLTAGNNNEVGEEYRGEITYVLSGTTYYTTLFYDVVRSTLKIVISDDDIHNELPQLRKLGYRVHGTADSGSATTIVDSELKQYEDDYFTGGLATSLTNEETREITGFVSSTGTVTTTAFGTAISTDKYLLVRAYTREIRRSFEKLEERLKARGKRSHLILDSYDIREAHILAAVSEVCKGQVSDSAEGSLWWELWKDFERKADMAFNSLSLKYDSSGDGAVSGSELGRRMSAMKVKF